MGDEIKGENKREKKSKCDNISNDERKRIFKPKRAVVDSSDDSSPSGNGKSQGKLHPGSDSSETDDHHDEERKTDSKPKKRQHIYSDSESDQEADKKSQVKSALSDSESDVTDSKSSALAVLAMNKKKEPPKPEVKNEPVSSEGEEDIKPSRN